MLRPLIVVDLVGAGPFAATNAGIQRATTVTRAASPLAFGVIVSTLGWTPAWIATLVAFVVAGERYLTLGRSAHRPERGTVAMTQRSALGGSAAE